MASDYKIHRPYVLAALPRPLDHTDGRIVAREVYGQRNGDKKRKRMELVVGVDGETTSIYDIPASRLITSYPIPPQESFTCPPYSIRIRLADSPDVYRYTYIATKDAKSYKITLFKDVVHPDGKTTSTSTSQTVQTSPVRCITSSSSTKSTTSLDDIVAICEDGQVVYLSAEDLAVQWSAASKSAVQEATSGLMDKFEVEYVSSGSVSDFKEGIFKSRPEVITALPMLLNPDPSLIFLIVKSIGQDGQVARHIVILAAMPGGAAAASDLQKLIFLEISPFTMDPGSNSETTVYQVDVQSGLLMGLADGRLTIFDLTGAVPQKKSVVYMDGAQSFARLSRPFLLSASSDSLVLYNHHYRSIHAKAELDLSELPADGQKTRHCQLITHLRSQDLVVALIDNVLVSVQVEPPYHLGKRRKEGLLIDSIGRGTSTYEIQRKKLKGGNSSGEFSRLLPGTLTHAYLARFQSESKVADEMLSNDELDKWEDLLRKKFAMRLRKERDSSKTSTTNDEEQESTEWDWLNKVQAYPAVDRRWVIYAMSRVFTVRLSAGEDSTTALRLALPDSNVTTYLAVAGHLTLSNLETAFREELSANGSEPRILASQLIQSLTDADPSMTLLLHYLQATKLGEVELLLAIRSIMLSMDLLPDAKKPSTRTLLANEAHKEGENEGPEMDLDALERDIAVTEHYLGDETSSRSRGLTLAFTKLWRIPALTTVKALRTTIRTEELLSFIYLLRVELVRGAWTSLYIDPTSFESEGNDPPPDGVITLIADLLGRCLDAVGAGGWLFNDAMSWADKAEAADFLTGLKLEVTAALEGIEEAVFLNGIVGETVRFGLLAEKSRAARQQWNSNNNKPSTLQVESRESRLLPLGLKTKLMPTWDKVVSGGEIARRSSRETGHLISQKVESYSLERVSI
ncbi:hypothetical protein E4U42_005558 [Claviceps africana]|uniref:Utp8 beta-propeller domain-containing protein n=1 Tax=Claviceps africana TaxID=83212 RepID=A0A8K0NLG4_9HYPO|nr:hypothetical protein E4U42_005558 [Claviceps africana]